VQMRFVVEKDVLFSKEVSFFDGHETEVVIFGDDAHDLARFDEVN
jgi:hypothetical protein